MFFICRFAMNFLVIDQRDQLLIVTNTIKIITILQPSNFNLVLHGYFLQCVNGFYQYFYNIYIYLNDGITIKINRAVFLIIWNESYSR